VTEGSLWRHADFMRLWVGQTVSEFGTVVTRTAVPLVAILVLGAGAPEVGTLVAVQSAGVLIVGLIAGAVVDRVRRRPVLIAADLVRAAVLLWIPFAFVGGLLRIEELYIVVFLVAVLSAFFESAYRAYLPSLVGLERTLEGNSKLGVSASVAEVAGPGFTGALIQVVSAPFAILVDAVSYLVSAASLLLIRSREPKRQVRPAGSHIAGEISEGLRVVGRHPLLRALSASSVTQHFFGSFIGALYSIYLIRDLGLSPLVLGLLISVGGVGALAGAALAVPVTKRLGQGPALIVTAFIEGLLKFLLPLAAVVPAFAVAFFFVGQLVGDALISAHFIVHMTVRQQVTEDRLLGRVGATINVLEHGVAPFGALIAAALAARYGTQLTLLIAAMGTLTATGWLVFSPLRSLRLATATGATLAH